MDGMVWYGTGVAKLPSLHSRSSLVHSTPWVTAICRGQPEVNVFDHASGTAQQRGRGPGPQETEPCWKPGGRGTIQGHCSVLEALLL